MYLAVSITTIIIPCLLLTESYDGAAADDVNYCKTWLLALQTQLP